MSMFTFFVITTAEVTVIVLALIAYRSIRMASSSWTQAKSEIRDILGELRNVSNDIAHSSSSLHAQWESSVSAHVNTMAGIISSVESLNSSIKSLHAPLDIFSRFVAQPAEAGGQPEHIEDAEAQHIFMGSSSSQVFDNRMEEFGAEETLG